MRPAYIVDAARTPRGIGKFGKGALTEIHPQRPLATVFRALEERNDLDTSEVEETIAATGSILIGTAFDELERQDKNTALITMCTGGDMAPAVIIERV